MKKLQVFHWKVVDRDMHSVSSWHSSVTYSTEKWTYPVGGSGPLCVFDSLKAARKFKGEYVVWDRGAKIFKCRITPSRESCVFYTKPDFRDGLLTRLEDLPPGTVLASAVKLTKREKNR